MLNVQNEGFDTFDRQSVDCEFAFPSIVPSGALRLMSRWQTVD
jgi:hypothetical protein